MILNEVQFAPALLSAIKRKVDQSDATGSYFLTGSQNFTMLKHIAETLTGRIVLFPLEGMTLHERQNLAGSSPWFARYLEDPHQFLQTKQEIIPSLYQSA